MNRTKAFDEERLREVVAEALHGGVDCQPGWTLRAARRAITAYRRETARQAKVGRRS